MATKTTTKTTTQDGPASSTKTTTTSYKTTSRYEPEIPSYKAVVGRKATVINRTVAGPPSLSGRVERSVSYGVQSMPSALGAYSAVTSVGVSQVREGRNQEKKDMQDLNERFASYIEKVRFLEAQNRKLADELDRLKSKWGKETSVVKAMYETELEEARKLLTEAENDKSRYELKATTLEDENEELRQRNYDLSNQVIQQKAQIESNNQQISDLEAEVNLLRRRQEAMETEREKDKKEIARLTEALSRARIDVDNETLNHIEAENKLQGLEEEMEFLKAVHEQEMRELAALAYRDTTAENREYWKTELGNCLREIQETYDEKLGTMRNELESFYNMKLQEFHTGVAKQSAETTHAKEQTKKFRQQLSDLRDRINDLENKNQMLQRELDQKVQEYADTIRDLEGELVKANGDNAALRAELNSVMKELQDLMDTKLGLELEIAAYRKLLEGEENRIGLRNVVHSMVTSHTNVEQEFQQQELDDDATLKVNQLIKGEMSAKTTYQRSAKGPVSICECTANGGTVTFENTGRKEENIGGCRIKRIVDGIEKVDFVLDSRFPLRGGQKRKVHSKAHDGEVATNDIRVEVDTWGIGATVITKLLNPAGEERATHVQRTVYS